MNHDDRLKYLMSDRLKYYLDKKISVLTKNKKYFEENLFYEMIDFIFNYNLLRDPDLNSFIDFNQFKDLFNLEETINSLNFYKKAIIKLAQNKKDPVYNYLIYFITRKRTDRDEVFKSLDDYNNYCNSQNVITLNYILMIDSIANEMQDYKRLESYNLNKKIFDNYLEQGEKFLDNLHFESRQFFKSGTVIQNELEYTESYNEKISEPSYSHENNNYDSLTYFKMEVLKESLVPQLFKKDHEYSKGLISLLILNNVRKHDEIKLNNLFTDANLKSLEKDLIDFIYKFHRIYNNYSINVEVEENTYRYYISVDRLYRNILFRFSSITKNEENNIVSDILKRNDSTSILGEFMEINLKVFRSVSLTAV